MVRKEVTISPKIAYLSSILRLVVPFFFFSFPVATTISMIIFDGNDGYLYCHAGFKIKKYQIVDKILDTYWYFFIMAYLVSNQTEMILFPLLTLLFFWRLVGQIIFFSTNKRKIFLFFPNLFEPLFWVQLIVFKFNFPQFLNPPLFFPVFLTIFLIVTIDEYLLHWRNFSWGNIFCGKNHMLWKKE